MANQMPEDIRKGMLQALLPETFRRAKEGNAAATRQLLDLMDRIQALEAPRSDTSAGAFPASPAVPGQAESRSAFDHFELAILPAAPWAADYLELRRLGWDWRKAVYIAWEACPLRPGDRRWPPTQAQLATQILGLRSDRAIRNWKTDPAIGDTIGLITAAPLLRHRRAVFEALATVASEPDPGAFRDRELFLKLSGDYRPDARLELGGNVDFEHGVALDLGRLTTGQLESLESIARALESDPGGTSAAPAD